MFRTVLFVPLFAVLACLPLVSAQQPDQPPAQQPDAAAAPPSAEAPQAASQQVADAEAAIAKSDWKSAETALNLWLASNPHDAHALFDSGYVLERHPVPISSQHASLALAK